MKIDFDVDIDMANRDDFLKLVNITPASIEKDGEFTKHNTGVYFQNIPKFPLEGFSTIDHKQAEEDGWFKVRDPKEPTIMLKDFRKDPVKNALATPSGKIEIFSKTVSDFGYDDCPGHPLV